MAKVCPTCNKEYDDGDVYCVADGTALHPATEGDDLIGSVVADRYLISDKIGEGGMGRVYLAKHVRLPQNVAIKVLHPAMVRDASVVARFRREAVNASQIENEHVARVFDHGEVRPGLFYIAMEFVEGEPLSRIIEREGPLPPARAAEITRQVAEALGAAHDRPTPIVHRDLKPDNIMVGVRRDGTDRVKVVDFGIAEAMSGGGTKLTQQGMVIGTPEYMSPEQLSATTLDWRSDIYSLALVTFTMFTGKLPFPAETARDAALMRLRDRPRTLAEMKPDVHWPPELQGVMDRALARAPTDRYATAPDFARALADAIAPHRAVTPNASADRVETPARPAAVARTRSRPAAIGGVAALGVAVMVSVGVLVWRGLAGNGNGQRPDTTSKQEEARDTTDTSGSGGDSIGARASLDFVASMIVSAERDPMRRRVLARAVIDSARAMITRFKAREDIVELGVYSVAAHLLLNEKSDACLVFATIATEAEQIRKFTEQVRLWNARLNCKN